MTRLKSVCEALEPVKAPCFSIITCTLNSAKYLAETIRSVECQQFDDYEHIFIDAFSSDETVLIINSYKLRHPEKVKLYQIPPKGISNAMNYGIDVARGDVLVHLHGDDYMGSTNVLGSVLQHLSTSDASIVIGNCRLVREFGSTYTWTPKPINFAILRGFFLSLMFYSNLVPHPATYLKRDVFHRHGKFDERYKVVMDYEFWLRVMCCEKFLIVKDVLAVYRFHSDTVSSQQSKLGLVEIRQIKEKYKRRYLTAYMIYFCLLNPLLAMRRALRAMIQHERFNK